MNPRERNPVSMSPPSRRIGWGDALRQAPLPPIPADFAARMQARVMPAPAAGRVEQLLTPLLMATLLVAGLAFAMPEVVEGFRALLARFGNLLPLVVAVGAALAAAWGVDRLAGRGVLPHH